MLSRRYGGLSRGEIPWDEVGGVLDTHNPVVTHSLWGSNRPLGGINMVSNASQAPQVDSTRFTGSKILYSS